MAKGLMNIILLTLISASIASSAIESQRWCGQLLERPLTPAQRQFAIDNNKRIRALDNEIKIIDSRLRKNGRSPFLDQERHERWIEKIQIRRHVLETLEGETALQGAHYVTVREILDAHAKAIDALRGYLTQLKRVRTLTYAATATEILDLVGAPFLGELEFVLKYLSLATITVHTHMISQVRVARGEVETEFVRLQELLLIYDERMGKRYPILKGEMPHSVLALSILDTFQLTPVIQQAIRPLPLSQVMSTINLLRLSRNHKKITRSTEEVIAVTEWLDKMSTRLERELWLELIQHRD